MSIRRGSDALFFLSPYLTTEMSETMRINSDYYAKLFVLKFENYINQTISAQEFGLFLDEYNAFLDLLISKIIKE